jgi:DNA-binding NarL/FixJ family response regulator
VEGARLYFEESALLYRTLNDHQALAGTLLELVDVAVAEKNVVQAATLAQESLALARSLDNRLDIVRALHWLAVTQSLQGESAQTVVLLEESLALAREQGYKPLIGTNELTLANILLSRGDLLRAETCAQESLALFRELGNQVKTARLLSLLSLLGEIRRRQGHLTQAREIWIEAARRAGAAGNPSTRMHPLERADYERAVESVRTQLGEEAFAEAWAQGCTMTAEPAELPPASTPATYPDGLTAREVEVLRLVASGLSNIQVSQRLVISRRTVDTHLTSIYSKIGVSSRSAATRYAIEHHLV